MTSVANRCTLVAGGAGFVGSTLVRELLARNCRVVVYDSFVHGARDHVAGLADVVVVEGDACDRAKLTDVMRGERVELVFNCVGDTFVPDAYTEPERFFRNNLSAAMSVLLAARDVAVERVLYVSSTEVYGVVPVDRRIDESLPTAPVNTYAVSKLAADRLCYTMHLEHRIPVVLARIFNCYGPRETHPYIVPELIAQLARGRRVRLGNVRAFRDFTFVEDTARALIALMERAAIDASPVNVGSGQAISIEELARRVGRVLGHDSIEIEVDDTRMRRHDIECFVCDNTRLRELTGWRPTVELDAGLRRTVDWYVANGRRWSFDGGGHG